MSMRNMRKWFEGQNSLIINSGGAPVVASPAIFPAGTSYFVDSDNGSDSSDGLTPDTAKATIAAAYALMTSNANDVMYISANAGHTLTGVLDVTKNRCHFIGCDFAGRSYGARSRISIGVTTDTDDIAAIKNTGVGNTFRNLKISSSNTLTEGLYAFADGGEYTLMDSCELYLSSQLDATGAAELLCNGDSSIYRNCTIGSNANAISGAIIRPCVLVSRETITGKVARDVTFQNCYFWRKCGNSANRFVYGANATDVERMMLFDHCLFFNTKLATATPAQNVAFGASQTEGYVLLWDCASIGAATAMSTTTGVFIQGYTPDATGAAAGIAIQCA